MFQAGVGCAFSAKWVLTRTIEVRKQDDKKGAPAINADRTTGAGLA